MYFLMALTKPVIEAMIILSARVGLHVFLFELWVGYCDLSTYLERSIAMTSFFTINKARLTCLQNTIWAGRQLNQRLVTYLYTEKARVTMNGASL